MTFTVTVAAALVALAGFLFYTNLRDARADAAQEAKKVAVQEAHDSIEKAFDEKNVNDLIQKVAQEKIAAITDRIIEQQLTSKLQPIQKRILSVGEISEIEIQIRRGLRSGLEELMTFMGKTNDPDTLQFARKTFQTTAQDYELSAQRQVKDGNSTPYRFLRAFMNRPTEGKTMPEELPGVVLVINKDQDL